MAEPIHHEAVTPIPKLPFGLHLVLLWIFGGKFLLYLYDYVMVKLSLSKRYRQLTYEQLTCRFCGTPIELLSLWKCECGYTRPGSYFARCPKCLGHPEYIDCPACHSTMDVR